MEVQALDGSIVLVKDSAKSSIIETIRRQNSLLDIKVLGLDEFKKKFYFDYSKQAIYYVHKNYRCIKDIAKIYLENLYYLKDIKEEKVRFLSGIKADLESHQLLEKNAPFRNYIKNKRIVLYDINYVDKFYMSMFEEIEKDTTIERINTSKLTGSKKEIYKLPNKEQEVAFVASKIAELIKKGINIKKIKLANVNDSYIFTIRRIFKDFKIPISLPSNETIASTILVSKFKELYSDDMESTLNSLKEYVKDDASEKIYGRIVDVLNDYAWTSNYLEVKDFLLDDIDKIKTDKTLYKNAVETIDFVNDTIAEDEYVFLINFNQGVTPINKKDEDFLNDEIKRKLGISDSVDINKKRTLEVQNRIASTKNLIVSYSERDMSSELYISNAYSEELFTPCEYEMTFEHSDAYNKKVLLCEKDENKKYGTKTDRLSLLKTHYKDAEYETYDNTFKGLEKTKLKTVLKNRLTLSYSSMNTYYHCGYRYYLDYILKINKYEDSFEQVVGNIFHRVLSHCFKEDFNFDLEWQNAIEKETYEFKNKENFFLSILHDELIFIIDAIKKESDYTELNEFLFEKEIIIPIDKENGVNFKGFVDKIKYGEFDGQKIVSIIDYKTGNPELKLDNAIYGLDLQLPIYAYLVKKSEDFPNVRIGGFYLQKILNNIKDEDKRLDSLKLQGYSNSSLEILTHVDKTYMASKMIKSLRMKSDGFYPYAKVLSDAEIDKLITIVEERILEASKNILDAKFDINPKQVGDKLLGCTYCKYKDICYMKNKDIKKLKSVSQKDFLGGEQHADMD